MFSFVSDFHRFRFRVFEIIPEHSELISAMNISKHLRATDHRLVGLPQWKDSYVGWKEQSLTNHRFAYGIIWLCLKIEKPKIFHTSKPHVSIGFPLKLPHFLGLKLSILGAKIHQGAMLRPLVLVQIKQSGLVFFSISRKTSKSNRG